MKWVIGFCVWLVLVIGAAAVVELGDRNEVGGAYAAKEVCSCVHVGGRPLDACKADLAELPGLGWLKIEATEDGTGVRAGLRGFPPRVARAKPDRGCTLEP
jgi:hypothetical protein